MIVVLTNNVELQWLSLKCYGKKLHFLKLFKQYFENVCSSDLMNKMQLKLLGFLAHKIRTKMTKHKPSGFYSKQFFCLLELTTPSIFNRFKHVWYQSLSLSFCFPTSYNLLVYLISLPTFAFSNLLTFIPFSLFPHFMLLILVPTGTWVPSADINKDFTSTNK